MGWITDALDAMIQALTDLMSNTVAWAASLFSNLTDTCLYAERLMPSVFNYNGWTTLTSFMVNVGLMFIIIKLVRKFLDVYVFYQDGDPDTDPFTFLSSFFKAVTMIFIFPTVFDIVATLTKQFTAAIMDQIVLIDASQTITIAMMPGAGMSVVLTLIIGIVWLVMAIGLYIQLLVRGLELMVLKLVFPIACVGIIDADNGIYSSFIKKLTQTFFSIIAQVCLATLSITLLVGGQLFWGIAACSLALKTPAFLAEFMVGGNGGGISKTMGMVTSGSRMTKGVINVFKK